MLTALLGERGQPAVRRRRRRTVHEDTLARWPSVAGVLFISLAVFIQGVLPALMPESAAQRR